MGPLNVSSKWHNRVWARRLGEGTRDRGRARDSGRVAGGHHRLVDWALAVCPPGLHRPAGAPLSHQHGVGPLIVPVLRGGK